MSEIISSHDASYPADLSFRRLLNHLPGMAYRCIVYDNFAYTLDFVSQGVTTLLGKSAKELLDIKTNVIERMTRASDLVEMRKAISEAILAKTPYETSYHITLDNGEEKWIWDQGAGVYNADGKCVFIEGIMMDITAQQAKLIELQQENYQLQSAIKNSYGLGEMVGKSDAMQAFYQLILQAAKNDSNVVLYGETGVGKDLAARTIHELSGLKGRYVPVNCAAIPEQLLESQFFGHVKGAFSGAVSNQTGFLGAAHNGTLFLDEVAELPPNLQVKLLRSIESRSYSPVGSHEIKRSNFRLISATNRNMQEQVRNKQMRADFYYRLHVLVITIPPLRKRIGDLPLLIDTYAKRRGITVPIPPQVYLAMEQYHWPGNIRELQNVLERYWAFGDLDIAVSESLDTFRAKPKTPGGQFSSQEDFLGMSLEKSLEQLEKKRILLALEKNKWRKGVTANSLGITLRTLQRKIKKYGIDDYRHCCRQGDNNVTSCDKRLTQ